jgi:hypothetical protein
MLQPGVDVALYIRGANPPQLADLYRGDLCTPDQPVSSLAANVQNARQLLRGEQALGVRFYFLCLRLW